MTRGTVATKSLAASFEAACWEFLEHECDAFYRAERLDYQLLGLIACAGS